MVVRFNNGGYMKIEDIRAIERVQLTFQEGEILKFLAYGLEANHVASILGISKQRVSQIKKSAMSKLEAQGFMENGKLKHNLDLVEEVVVE